MIASLGPAAQVSIKEKATSKEMASLSLYHGDILYLPNCEALGRTYQVRKRLVIQARPAAKNSPSILQMKVVHSEVSVTCIARCLQSPALAPRNAGI